MKKQSSLRDISNLADESKNIETDKVISGRFPLSLQGLNALSPVANTAKEGSAQGSDQGAQSSTQPDKSK